VVIVAAFQRAFIWQVRQTRDAVREELAVTFRGLEDRLDGLARAQELHAAAQRDDSRRIARLERQIDEILHISADTIVPRQTDIARKLDIRDEES
jgi:regulator of protease activity HflC (stomatin/prohibitin superfamily)